MSAKVILFFLTAKFLSYFLNIIRRALPNDSELRIFRDWRKNALLHTGKERVKDKLIR
jgi:hypothetical protein